MALVPRPATLPESPGQWGGGEPLWKLVPKRDADGRAYADFMMVAPALKRRTPHELAVVARVIQGVLAGFGDQVAFADFNMKLMLLWVSLPCRPGLMFRMVGALRAHVPELKLVAHHHDHGV
ncbi:MAG: hypothetical protein AB1831_00160 [Pseudomonadota bacterium]